MWKQGVFERYFWIAKVYDESSEFGINNGRVSKLTINIGEVIKMTKIQVLNKAKSMLKDDTKFLLFRIERLLECGGIDKKEYENDFRLPKILLYAALDDLKIQRRPLTTEDYKAAQNLSHFA